MKFKIGDILLKNDKSEFIFPNRKHKMIILNIIHEVKWYKFKIIYDDGNEYESTYNHEDVEYNYDLDIISLRKRKIKHLHK